MALDDELRARVILVGGKATGVECPACGASSRDVDLEKHELSPVTCPDCGTVVLTDDQMARLRRANKL